jgi:hypothetical protein
MVDLDRVLSIFLNRRAKIWLQFQKKSLRLTVPLRKKMTPEREF